MKVRLAFAVAAHLEPEVLIIDEVLAVGDMEFQKKCLGKLKDVAKGGRTVVFVSHDMAAVRSLTTIGAYLDKGHLVQSGATPEIIDRYLGDAVQKVTEGSADVSYFRRDSLNENSEAHFVKIWIGDQQEYQLPVQESGESILLNMELIAKHPITSVWFAITLVKDNQHTVATIYSADMNFAANLEVGINHLKCRIQGISLSPGRYSATIGVTKNEQSRALDLLLDVPLFEVKMEEALSGKIRWTNRPWGVIRLDDVSWTMG